MASLTASETQTGPFTGTSDALFAIIEKMQQKHRANSSKQWGRFLDAGTGAHSLSWVRKLPLTSWSAITADSQMKATVEKEVSVPNSTEAQGEIVLGNWDDENLLEGKTYEVVLADYLIGSMDGFSPFKQDLIFDRLKRHIDPNTGILYIIGLEPIPYNENFPADVICDVVRMRDACILLAGHRCYREYPMSWVERMLESHGFKVLSTEKLPILYSEHSIRRQLNVARSKLPLFKDRALASAMGKSIDSLDGRMKDLVNRAENRRIRQGFDYVIAAELSSPTP